MSAQGLAAFGVDVDSDRGYLVDTERGFIVAEGALPPSGRRFRNGRPFSRYPTVPCLTMRWTWVCSRNGDGSGPVKGRTG